MTIAPHLQTVAGLPVITVEPELRALIADTLDIDLSEVTSDLGLHAIPEWSSLDHVTLMAAIEDRFGCSIDGPLVTELTTVAALERFLANQVVSSAEATKPQIHRGLDGVHFDESLITEIDGIAGRLTVRGFSIQDIAEHSSFVETCHLVLFGIRPNESELADLTRRLLKPEPLPPTVASVVASMAGHHPMAALRTALSMLNSQGPSPDRSPSAIIERGLVATGQANQILALHHRSRYETEQTTERSSARPSASHSLDDPTTVSGALLQQIFGRSPSALESEAFDLVRRIQIEHGSNASTFAARVAAAAGAEVGGSLVAALATFEGPLHGAAIEGVIDALREIGTPERAEQFVARRRAGRKPIMGFGHRVYKVEDPRAAPLRSMANRLADERGDRWAVDVVAALELAMAPHQRHGLGINVDTYAAIIYHLLGFSEDCLTALYAISRMIGWTAHIAEQIDRNVLIRPRLFYVGPEQRSWDANRGEARPPR